MCRFDKAKFSALLVLACVGARPLLAATSTVTTTADSGPGSLRDAIASASSGDTITFSLTYPATITIASTLWIGTNLTISGPGDSHLAISGNNTVQVLQIGSGVTAVISGVTIESGFVGDAGVGNAGVGAGISNGGTLTLTNSTLSRNAVFGEGAVRGGGIYNAGTLTLTNTSLFDNNAFQGGGIYNDGGTVTLVNSTLSGNISHHDGAGIFTRFGTLTLVNTTLSGNVSTDHCGGVCGFGTIALINSTLSGNTDVQGAGGIVVGGTLTLKNTIIANSGGGNCSVFATVTSY